MSAGVRWDVRPCSSFGFLAVSTSSSVGAEPAQPIQKNGIYHHRSVSITLSDAYSSVPRKRLAMNLRLMASSASRIVAVVANIVRKESNAQHQRRQPAATDIRIVNGLNDWLPAAAC